VIGEKIWVQFPMIGVAGEYISPVTKSGLQNTV